MMVVKGLVKGPFKSEQQFKAAVLKVWREEHLLHTYFEIENEEKEPGMPDVLVMAWDSPAEFVEFKISDNKGVVAFQKTQPLFYKQHYRVWISIFAWDVPRQRVVSIDPGEVVAAKSLRIQIPEALDDA